MKVPEHLGEPKPLRYFVDNLSKLPEWVWLYISESTQDISFEVQCFPTIIDGREFSNLEADRFDVSVSAAGLMCFFCTGQLEDIIENLRQQKSTFSVSELEKAIDFYWKRDAFIVLF